MSSKEAGDLTQTVANHYNQLQETGLDVRKQSRIFYLRNFNNWVKSVLIGETLQQLRKEDRNRSVTVLDFCSGKGGDLLKWKKGNIDRLVCVDIAATSVEQCETRFREMRSRGRGRSSHDEKMYDAEFLVADCTKLRLKDMYKDPSILFDLVSCQFSFHYSFESYPQAVTMMRNAAECLRPGGYFIGTTPNAYELIRRLQDSPDNSFGNDVYRVTFDEKDPSCMPLFGARYNFHLEGVVDCPEFLVYFPLLERLAQDFGLELVKWTRFDDYFREFSKIREHRTLLNKMQALEPYPVDGGRELVGDTETDYIHASQFLQSQNEADTSQEGRRPQKIGTMSKAEWDATTIYLAFVFRKKKE